MEIMELVRDYLYLISRIRTRKTLIRFRLMLMEKYLLDADQYQTLIMQEAIKMLKDVLIMHFEPKMRLGGLRIIRRDDSLQVELRSREYSIFPPLIDAYLNSNFLYHFKVTISQF